LEVDEFGLNRIYCKKKTTYYARYLNDYFEEKTNITFKITFSLDASSLETLKK
jgi:hypothetical protein